MTSQPETTVAAKRPVLEYGPAPEAADAMQAWFDSHGRRFGVFIDNKFVNPKDGNYSASESPAGVPMAETLNCTAVEVDEAVASSVKAHAHWSKLSGYERGRHMYNVARNIQKHMRILAVLESADNGKSIRESRDIDTALIVRHWYFHAGQAHLMETEMREWTGIGVVGAITPWNFPLMLMCWKICPALAMGNTVVLKPASVTRLSALLLAEVCAEAGLPPGVLNIVTGSGAMGTTLATHPDVAKVAFTGSTEVGRLLRTSTAGMGKKLSLELGGKSPMIVFDSADLDSAVEGVVDAIWFNQGEVCSAGSRLLLQESVYDEVVKKLKRRLTTFRLGHSLDKCIDMGPLISQAQYDSVKKYVDIAREEGGDIFQAEGYPSGGLYYPPTMILGLQTMSTCVMEEVFGPVLCVLPFRTAKEAMALANNTNFGLGASVWTQDIALALEMAIGIKAGAVWINAHNLFDAAAGFGGYRESGFGRDGGKEGLFEYVRPDRPKVPVPAVDEAKFKAFGATVPPGPLPDMNGSVSNAVNLDHTNKMYIGGSQKRPDGNYSRGILSVSGSVLGQVGEGSRKDIRDAVEAARKAAPVWSKRAAFNRAQICFYLAENLDRRKQEFANQLLRMTGASVEDSLDEVERSIERLFWWASYADKFGGEVKETTQYGLVTSINEPVGVIGILCPDENPLLSFVSLIAPALVRANTVVVVPSEKYPLCAAGLYQVFETSDLLAGVVNIVTGDRDHLSKTLAEHMDVDAIWYHGSIEGCKFVEQASAGNLKRTWVNWSPKNWRTEGTHPEFLYHATEVKNVWAPMGDIFAN
eukprot:GEMP01014494.1.p1 GENE.GEMP01014494.1~~GEMP01014494.1.p1  ORF type:complete len:812 (+),score=207.01 GEMP01014494.1:70-2505(+)